MQTVEEAIAEAEAAGDALAVQPANPAAAQPARRRRPAAVFGMKPANAGLLGLVAACIATGFAGGKRAHIALGLAMAAGLGWHAWNRRRAR